MPSLDDPIDQVEDVNGNFIGIGRQVELNSICNKSLPSLTPQMDERKQHLKTV